MKTEISTIIVDDEPLACKRLQKLLANHENVQLVAVCNNGAEAITQINARKPDLVFLDIQMPEITGFDVLQKIEKDHAPAIIFVTAYDEYAIKAFEVHAADYLLKPFDKHRFNEALQQAVQAIRNNQGRFIAEKLDAFLETVSTESEPVRRILVKSSGKFFFLSVGDIEWIESAGNYIRVHSKGKSYLIRDTMTNMENKLNTNRFFRIHRSYIINVDHVKELEQWFHGDYKVTMKNGQELTMSRNYKHLLEYF